MTFKYVSEFNKWINKKTASYSHQTCNQTSNVFLIWLHMYNYKIYYDGIPHQLIKF